MARFVRVVVHGVFQVWVRLITPTEEQVVTLALSRDEGWALLEIVRIHQSHTDGVEETFATNRIFFHVGGLDGTNNGTVLRVQSLVHDLAVSIEEGGTGDHRTETVTSALRDVSPYTFEIMAEQAVFPPPCSFLSPRTFLMDSSLANTPVVAESEWAMDNRVAIDWSFMLMFLLVAGSASSDVSFGSSMLIWSISSRNYDHCGVFTE